MTNKSSLKCGFLIPICILFLTVLIVSISAEDSASNSVSSKTVNEKKTNKEGRRYCEWNTDCASDEYCDYYDNTCEDYDNYGLAVGVIITIAIGIPLAIAIGVALCCVYCSGCPLNRRRNRNRVPNQQFVQYSNGQANIAYDQQGRPVIFAASPQAYGAPMNGNNGQGYAQQQFQGQPAPGAYPVQSQAQTQAPGWVAPQPASQGEDAPRY